MRIISVFLILLIFGFPSIAQDIIPVFSPEDPALYKSPGYLSKTAVKKIGFSENLGFFSFPEKEGRRKIGAIDKHGKIIIPPAYSEVQQPQKGIWALKTPENFYEFFSSEHGLLHLHQCDTFQVYQHALLWRENFKWHVRIKNQELDVKPALKEVEISGDKIKGKTFNAWTLEYNKANTCCLSFDNISFADTRIIYERDHLKGIADAVKKGVEITSPKYSRIDTFPGGVFKVQEKMHWGIMDKAGHVVVPVQYDSLSLLCPDYVKAFIRNKGYELFNLNGERKIHSVYSDIGAPSEGLIPVKMDGGLWGYVDYRDSVKIPARYTEAFSFRNGHASVSLGGARGIIDKTGNWFVAPEYFNLYKAGLYTKDSSDNIHYLFKPERYAYLKLLEKDRILFTDNSQFGVMDASGKIIVPPAFDSIKGPYPEKVFIVLKGKSWGIVDLDGNVLSEPAERLERIYDFHEQRARILKAGLFGFVDPRGNVRVAPQYKQVHDFKEGLAAVPINGKWGFIDKDENIVVQPLYDEVKDFEGGLARCRAGRQWYFVTRAGKKVSEHGYDVIDVSAGGKWLIQKNGKSGLADSSGRELLAPRYESLKDLLNGKVIARKSGKWGVVDYRENFIYPFQYEKILYSEEEDIFAFMSPAREEIITITKEK